MKTTFLHLSFDLCDSSQYSRIVLEFHRALIRLLYQGRQCFVSAILKAFQAAEWHPMASLELFKWLCVRARRWHQSRKTRRWFFPNIIPSQSSSDCLSLYFQSSNRNQQLAKPELSMEILQLMDERWFRKIRVRTEEEFSDKHPKWLFI